MAMSAAVMTCLLRFMPGAGRRAQAPNLPGNCLVMPSDSASDSASILRCGVPASRRVARVTLAVNLAQEVRDLDAILLPFGVGMSAEPEVPRDRNTLDRAIAGMASATALGARITVTSFRTLRPGCPHAV